MIEIVLATKNEGKAREFREIMKDLPIKLLSLRDFPAFGEIKEDGRTFEENALKKARPLAGFGKNAAIADDSGLTVDVLNGAPGIFSARYAGPGAVDLENNLKLLKELDGLSLERRGAAFKCAIAIVTPNGTEHVVTGECLGRIGFEMRGSDGFGYDPIFIPDGFEKTFAELGMKIKNRISHRSKAIEGLCEILKKLLISCAE